VASQDQRFPAADITEFEWGAKDKGNKQLMHMWSMILHGRKIEGGGEQ
jgi:hypothetical protein